MGYLHDGGLLAAEHHVKVEEVRLWVVLGFQFVLIELRK